MGPSPHPSCQGHKSGPQDAVSFEPLRQAGFFPEGSSGVSHGVGAAGSSRQASPSLVIRPGLYLELESLPPGDSGSSVTLKSPVQLSSWSPLCQPNWRPLARERGSRYSRSGAGGSLSTREPRAVVCPVAHRLDHTLSGDEGDGQP